MHKPLRTLRLLLLVGASFGLAADSSARIEDLRWSDSTGAASGYVIHVGSESRSYSTQIDAGVPSTDSDGAFLFSIQVPDEDIVYLAITSYNGSGVQSSYSNERIRVPADWEPPQGGSGGGNDPNNGGGSSGGDPGSGSGGGSDPAPPSGPPPTSYRLNAGGGDFVDGEGQQWTGDDTVINAGNAASTQQSVAGIAPAQMITTERYKLPGSNLTYDLPLADGRYTVRLHFAEVYSQITGPGQRTFDVSAEGQSLMTAYDIYGDAGFAQAVEKVFTVDVTGGSLELVFSHGVQNPKVCGIEVDYAGDPISVGQPGKPTIVLP